MRFEAEVEAGKGRQVWAAIEELAAGYLKDEVAGTMDQARADALVDLVLANVSVSTVVDLALPAGFATAGPARTGSCASCGRGGARAGGSALEAGHRRPGRRRPDADQNSGADQNSADQNRADHGRTGRGWPATRGGNVFRLLSGLPTTGFWTIALAP